MDFELALDFFMLELSHYCDVPLVIKLSPSFASLFPENLFFNSFDFSTLLTSSSKILSFLYSKVSTKFSYDGGEEQNSIKARSSLSIVRLMFSTSIAIKFRSTWISLNHCDIVHNGPKTHPELFRYSVLPKRPHTNRDSNPLYNHWSFFCQAIGSTVHTRPEQSPLWTKAHVEPPSNDLHPFHYARGKCLARSPSFVSRPITLISVLSQNIIQACASQTPPWAFSGQFIASYPLSFWTFTQARPWVCIHCKLCTAWAPQAKHWARTLKIHGYVRNLLLYQ